MTDKNNIAKRSLTQSQLALWAGQRINPDAPLYNMVHSFEIPIALNVDAFRNAFQKVVDDTDVLRTVFDEEEGVPYQVVLPKIDCPLEVFDFVKENGESEARNWMQERSQLNFDLSEILFDSALLKLNDDRYLWFLNIHHLITDATSSTLLYKKVLEHYFNFAEIEKKEVAPLPQFANYLDFEKQQQEGGQNEDLHAYWEEKTKTLVTAPQLYGQNKNNLSTAAERVSIALGTERSQKLKQLAQKTEIRSFTINLTLFNLFSTLLFIYLYRISGQKLVAIGAPSHNRPTKTLKKTAGLFIEIFPLVAQFEDDDTFLSVFERVKIEANNYLRYAQPGMATSTISKSFNAILNYITANFDNFDGIPAKSEWIHPGHCDPAHHLRCHVYDFDSSGNIEVHFDLNTDVFDKETRKLVPSHFLKLLDALLENIDQPITKPSLVTEQEKIQFLKSDIKTSNPFASIISQFETQVSSTPDAIALRFKNEILTYKNLNDRANKLANYLRKKEVEANDSIAVYMERRPDYLVSVLAILKLGATFLPISSDQPKERIDFILKDSGSKKIIIYSTSKETDLFENVDLVDLNIESKEIEKEAIVFDSSIEDLESTAYIIYTSGSTGRPKGVLISNASISNYLAWAKEAYELNTKFIFPLFTSIGFDLTITSTFLPLLNGGELIIYTESSTGPDISVMQVIEDNLVNSIKLTPSHLTLLQESNTTDSKLRLMIVGGEDFKSSLASHIQESLGEELRIFNEYGPTEATVGCIVNEFDSKEHTEPSVPIGKPIANMQAFILDAHHNLVPKGVVGELYLSGVGLAKGYANLEELTKERFLKNPFRPEQNMYRTGDLARWNRNGDLEYLGRNDEQVKLNGFRIELPDIESNIGDYPGVENAAVVLVDNRKVIPENEIINCKECGLPSTYPKIDFDANDVCHLCNSFKGYKEKTDIYFKSEDELHKLLTSKKEENRKYDCLSLLSGGKDSTYVLARLINMGLKVLAFTLDNGYISDQAKANITRITKELGVDHTYGQTPHMNKIFVDSLHRHKNVCNGCFKVIYTLSTKVALENDIPFVVTGLSRGQFFETRLTEELFWNETVDTTTIDDTILEARKLYHQEEDAVKQHLDTSMFSMNSTFEKVQYVDFYRYSDVSLTEMLRYLKEKAKWVRPTDTGRSTNCLINQAGIYVHKKERGYSNYSFPYSWDVRLSHKNRDEALEEINEYIDVTEVEKILGEIGYKKSLNVASNSQHLIGYYTGGSKIPSGELNRHLSKKLPEYMLPTSYEFLEELPLTANGKIDKSALRSMSTVRSELDTTYVAPSNEIEVLMEGIWKEVLQIERIGVKDNFIALGGHSLAAIRVTARINDELQTSFPLNKVFEFPTLEGYANYIAQKLTELLQQ